MRIIIISLIVIFLSLTLKAQNKLHTNFESFEKYEQHRNYFNNYAKEHFKLSDNSISVLYSNRINITKHEQLEKLGFNFLLTLQGICGTPPIYRKYESAIFTAPIIFRGELVAINENHNESIFFKTEYVYLVNKMLLNDSQSEIDTVRIISSANRKNKIGNKAIVFGEPFRWNSRISRSLRMSNKQKLAEELMDKYSVDYLKINTYCYELKTLTIMDNNIIDTKGIVGSKREILSKIKKVLKINNREEFYTLNK